VTGTLKHWPFMRWGWGYGARVDAIRRQRKELGRLTAKQGRAGNAGKEKYNTTSRSGVHARCDVQECDPHLLARVVELVTTDGDCIMFSRTSDGGALHIRVLSEGTVAKWYPSTNEELQDVLEGIEHDLQDVAAP